MYCISQKSSLCIASFCVSYHYRHMSDSEAWLELCDVYLQEHEYDKAAFCMEELLLCKPYNHLVHQKYAEVAVKILPLLPVKFLSVDSNLYFLLLLHTPFCLSYSIVVYCEFFYCSRSLNYLVQIYMRKI